MNKIEFSRYIAKLMQSPYIALLTVDQRFALQDELKSIASLQEIKDKHLRLFMLFLADIDEQESSVKARGYFGHAGRPGQRGGSAPRRWAMVQTARQSGQNPVTIHKSSSKVKLPYRADTSKPNEYVQQSLSDGARMLDMEPKEYEAYLINEFKTEIANRPISMRITSATLDKLINDVEEDGRIKTQFEVGKSRGRYDPKGRKGAEKEGLNYPEREVADRDRPKYGYFDMGEAGRESQYGEIQLVFKSEVRERSTFTVGDSLSSFMAGSANGTPINDPHINSFDNRMQGLARARINGRTGRDLFTVAEYIEVQIHGDLNLSHVSAIVDRTGKISKPKIRSLEKRGIRVLESLQ